MAQMVKESPAMKETRVQSLSREDPLQKGMATHSSILKNIRENRHLQLCSPCLGVQALLTLPQRWTLKGNGKPYVLSN